MHERSGGNDFRNQFMINYKGGKSTRQGDKLMSDETAITEPRMSYETKVLAVGSLLGALVGLAGAFLLIKNTERKGTDLNVSAGVGVKLSLIILALLRQLADL